MKRLLCLMVVLSVGIVHAVTTVIYQEDFSGDGSALLNGNPPDVDNYAGGGNLWTSNHGFYTDGVIGGGDGSALLPFIPQAGVVYELSADLAAIAGIENWFGIGFQTNAISAPAGSSGADRMSNAGGYSWIYYRDPLEGSSRYDGQISFAPGINTTGYQYLGHLIDDVTVPHTFKIVLDTTGATWTTQAFLDGTAISDPLSLPSSAATDIQYVGITSDYGGLTDSGTIDNFVFTVTDTSVPEIHTVADYPDLVYDIYVDATMDNLWPTKAANYPDLEDWTQSVTDANEWYTKTGSAAAINGTSFEGFGVDLPQLTMTIDGLDSAKMYDVYAVCWVKKHISTEYWYTDAGIGGNQLKLCDYYNAKMIFNEGQFIIQGAQVYLGQVSGVTSCEVDVDGPVTNSATSRAWFDGVALVEAKVDTVSPTPGQHDYTDSEVVSLNAYDYVDCPEYYTFSRWIGDVADPYLPQTTIVMDAEKTVSAVFSEFEGAVCGDVCHPILPGDVTADCLVDMDDLVIMANDWFGHVNY